MPSSCAASLVAMLHAGALMGPTIRLRPGDVLRLGLENRLPACTAMAAHGCVNDTNIHTHGLWVSPAGNSDNVLIAVPPGGRFDYEYLIPNDHPAGTFGTIRTDTAVPSTSWGAAWRAHSSSKAVGCPRRGETTNEDE